MLLSTLLKIKPPKNSHFAGLAQLKISKNQLKDELHLVIASSVLSQQ